MKKFKHSAKRRAQWRKHDKKRYHTRDIDERRASRRKSTAKWREKYPARARASVARLYANHPGIAARYARKSRMLRKYGMTLEDYDRMHTYQNGRCAICGKKETSKYKGTNRRLSVDHATSKSGRVVVRSLLCLRCNTAIGLMLHDREILAKAIEYLARHAARIA